MFAHYLLTERRQSPGHWRRRDQRLPCYCRALRSVNGDLQPYRQHDHRPLPPHGDATQRRQGPGHRRPRVQRISCKRRALRWAGLEDSNVFGVSRWTVSCSTIAARALVAATTSLSDSHPWALKRLDACRESRAETLSTAIPFYFYVHRANLGVT